jgi:hypothetical protein
VFLDASRGCWVGVLDVGRDPETGKRYAARSPQRPKTECKDKLDELREEYRKAATVGRRDITVRWAVEAFLAHTPESWKSENTLVVYRDAGKRVCDGVPGVPGIGRIALFRLTVGTWIVSWPAWPGPATRRRRSG